MKQLELLCVLPVLVGLGLFLTTAPCRAEGEWETTPASEKALKNGLNWLVQNQGGSGNWDSDDLGLVSLGALAFLADGHRDGIGVGSSRVDLQACKLEYSIVSPK